MRGNIGTLARRDRYVKLEADCQKKCSDDASCGKYMFGKVSLPWNCWTYGSPTGAHRAEHYGCNEYDSGFIVAAKRPLPPRQAGSLATCAGACASAPMGVAGANVSGCFCDDACVRHLDCCLDYVEHCRSEEGQQPTCKGRCIASTDEVGRDAAYIAVQLQAITSSDPVAIRGGGYCYCDAACVNQFTDNNSEGSCCADQVIECRGGAADPLCMDPRTQAAALHLFVAHHVVTNLDQHRTSGLV